VNAARIEMIVFLLIWFSSCVIADVDAIGRQSSARKTGLCIFGVVVKAEIKNKRKESIWRFDDKQVPKKGF
jgi:hypothetical protein